MNAPQLPAMPSERRFGLVFTAIFALLACYGYFLKSWGVGIATFLAIIAALFALATVLSPRMLAPLNRGWFLLGVFLGRFVSPIILAIIFFGVLTPVGLITRMFGRDELRLKKQPVDTEWIARTTPSPAGDMFKNQF